MLIEIVIEANLNAALHCAVGNLTSLEVKAQFSHKAAHNFQNICSLAYWAPTLLK
jgi:hypothetical protein